MKERFRRQGRYWIAGLLCLSLVVLLFWTGLQPEVIVLGVFTGSGWSVPSPQSALVIEKAIETFESQNPGVRVRYTSGIPVDAYSDWLAGQIVLGQTPDVLMVLPEDFDTLCSIGALASLDGWLQINSIGADTFYESALQAGQFQNRQYALPFECNVELLFANVSLLGQEGIVLPESLDLDTFYQICARVTQDKNGDGWLDQFGICNYTWKHAADAFGIELFNSEGSQVSLMGEDFQQALAYTQSLSALNQNMELQGEEDMFSAGKSAFAIMSFADYRTYRPYPWKIKKLSSFDWTVLPMPISDEGIGEVQTIQMAISAQSRHQHAAWKLLQTLCLDPQVQELHYAYSQGVSPLRSAGKEESEDSEVDYSILERVMDLSVRRAHFSRYTEALDYVGREMNQLLKSSQNQEILLIQAEEKINRYLNQ